MTHELLENIFCINLDHRTDRWSSIQVQAAKHDLDIKRFPGIQASEFKTVYHCDNANNGCTLSHYLLIQRAKLLGLKWVMILEDDAVFHRNFNKHFAECIEHLPYDWDMLYLGGTHKKRPTPVTPEILRIHETYCTHAYIIRESIYDDALQMMVNFDRPADCNFLPFQEKGYCYVTNPPLAWQLGDHSDIVGKTMKYPWLKTNNQ